MDFAKEFDTRSASKKNEDLPRKHKDDGWSSRGGYMKAKAQKLDSQFLSTTVEFKRKSNIFSGVSIWVNGYTQPSSDELKFLIKEHGGEYIHFFSKTKVSHIIANNIPESKIKDLKRNDQVVHPSWITESIKANKRLAVDKFLLHSVAKREGTVLKFKPEAQRSTDERQENVVSEKTHSIERNPTETYIEQGKGKAPTLTHHEYSATTTSTSAKAGDPNFISEFYAHSRLHHLSMWKAELKKFASSIQAKRKKSSDKSLRSERLIMHIDLDSFFVSVAIKLNPSLKGKPIAVCHATGKKDTSSESWSEIASCSYEARDKGVKNGMFLFKAKELCPDIVSVPYNFDEYRSVSQLFYEVLSTNTCNIEAVSCDEALVDISDLTNQETTAVEVAERFREQILEKTGCIASCGIGSNILLARMATKKAKPNGVYHVTDDTVKKFLFDKNVRDLPGTGRVLYNKLETMNVTTCGQLQNLSISTLQTAFGKKTGTSLYNYCRGIDERPLEYEHERKSVSAEINYGMRFTQEGEVLKFIGELAMEVEKRLKEISKIGSKITFKIMVRSKSASKETTKFLGHGLCDSLSKSVLLPMATDQASIIEKNCISMYRPLHIIPNDVRGMGIQITNLSDPSSAGKTTSIMNFTKQMNSTNMRNEVTKPSLPSWERINDAQGISTAQNYENLQSIDENVLMELPLEIQEEIKQQRDIQKKQIENKQMKNSPQKSISGKSPIKKVASNKSPGKQTSRTSPGKKHGRGRSKKLVETNKYGDIRRVTQKKPAILPNILLSPSQIDIDTVKELPEFLQQEVLQALKNKTSTSNNNASKKSDKVSKNLIDLTESSDTDMVVKTCKNQLVLPIATEEEKNYHPHQETVEKDLNNQVPSEDVDMTENLDNNNQIGTKRSNPGKEQTFKSPVATTSKVNDRSRYDDTLCSPSQLDQSFFNALPKNIQDDLMNDLQVMKRRKEASRDNEQTRIQRDPKPNIANNPIGSVLLSPSQLDQSVLAALPEHLKNEVVESVNILKKKKQRPLTISKAQEVPAAIVEEDETDIISEKRISLEQILPTLHGVTEIKGVKNLLREWIQYYDDPLEVDIDEVKKYFEELYSTHNMESMFILIKFLKRISDHSNSWRVTFNHIFAHVQLLLTRKLNSTFPIEPFHLS